MTTKYFIHKKEVYWFLLIIVLAIALRLFFFTGYNAGDDRGYIAKAFAYTQQDYAPPLDHWSARSGIVIPTAISFAVFGVNQFSTVFTPFVLSLSSICLIFFFASYLFDTRTGLLSAFFLSIFPMDVLFASTLFPNAFLSFFTMGSMFSFVYGIQKQKRGFVFFAGILLGLGYLAHITALYCLLFYALYFVFNRKQISYVLYFAGGLFLMFAGEMLVSYLLFNEPFARVDVLMGKVSKPSTARAVTSAVINKFINFQWLVEPFVRFFFEQEFALFFPFILFAVFYQIKIAKNRNAMLLILWIIPVFLYISYGTTSPTNYSPLRRLPRYYALITGPAMILVSFYLFQLKNRKLSNAVIVLLVISSLVCLYIDNSRYVKAPSLEMVDYIKSSDHDTVIIDRTLMFDYLFFTKFEKDPSLSLLVR